MPFSSRSAPHPPGGCVAIRRLGVCSDWLPRHKGERDAEADLAGGVVAGTRATQAEIDRHIVPYLPFRPPMSAERVAVAVKSRS